VLLNKGDGTFLPRVDNVLPNQAWGHELGDLNKDNRIDIVVANGGNTVSVLLGNGDGTFLPAQNYDTGGVIAIFPVVADFNRDRKPDIAVTHYYGDGSVTQPISLLLGVGDGTFERAQNYPFGIGSFGLAAGDLNNDRFPDLVVGDRVNYDVRVMLNDTIWAPPIPPVNGGPQPTPPRRTEAIEKRSERDSMAVMQQSASEPAEAALKFSTTFVPAYRTVEGTSLDSESQLSELKEELA
jgi:hypothetical protein